MLLCICRSLLRIGNLHNPASLHALLPAACFCLELILNSAEVNASVNLLLQSSGLVRHVFRLLQDTKDRCTPVPWVLLENVRTTSIYCACINLSTAIKALKYCACSVLPVFRFTVGFTVIRLNELPSGSQQFCFIG